jgi:hypothetical protein
MKKFLAKAGLLSLATATLMTSANAFTVTNASLDLTNYNKFKVITSGLTAEDIAKVTALVGDTNITITNSATTDEVNVSFDGNSSDTLYFSIPDADDINIVRGNTLNDLNVTIEIGPNKDHYPLTKTIGTLAVTDDAWNLITIPAGLHSNAREFIKANKVTMIWGWGWTGSQYDWVSYPSRMESGKGYWVRTRVAANTAGTLGDIIATDYNATVIGDYNGAEINTSNFAEVVSMIPKKDEWVLVGNSGQDAHIISSADGSEDNSSVYFFEDLLNAPESCYFVSIYHWDSGSDSWINDTINGATSSPIPNGAGAWVKQRLCNN